MVASTAVFGPVRSRRLGRIVGINNTPSSPCSYHCAYCQSGVPQLPQIERRGFYQPHALLDAVEQRLAKLRLRGESVDHLVFSPAGEPTLDAKLGRSIELLATLGLPIAVFTNGSLLTRDDVRAELGRADWVSIKIDSARERSWRQLNGPHATLRFDLMLQGMRVFAAQHRGVLSTDTTLVDGINTATPEIEAVADFIACLRPRTAYLGEPLRPTALSGCRPPPAVSLERARGAFSERGLDAVFFTSLPDADCAFTGDLASDLLGVTAVQPLSAADVGALLEKAGADWSAVQHLVAAGALRQVQHLGGSFFVGCLAPGPRRANAPRLDPLAKGRVESGTHSESA